MNAHSLAGLPAVIRKLARIYDDQQLEALMRDYGSDCRGMTNDSSQLHTANELLRVRQVARVLVNTCEFELKEIEPIVRGVLLPHPRRESIFRLIDEYTRDAVHFEKMQHERKRRLGARD